MSNHSTRKWAELSSYTLGLFNAIDPDQNKPNEQVPCVTFQMPHPASYNYTPNPGMFI